MKDVLSQPIGAIPKHYVIQDSHGQYRIDNLAIKEFRDDLMHQIGPSVLPKAFWMKGVDWPFRNRGVRFYITIPALNAAYLSASG